MYLSLQSATDKNTVSINIFNTAGQHIYTENDVLKKGINEINISTKELARGIYLVRILGEGAKESYHLVIQ